MHIRAAFAGFEAIDYTPKCKDLKRHLGSLIHLLVIEVKVEKTEYYFLFESALEIEIKRK